MAQEPFEPSPTLSLRRPPCLLFFCLAETVTYPPKTLFAITTHRLSHASRSLDLGFERRLAVYPLFTPCRNCDRTAPKRCRAPHVHETLPSKVMVKQARRGLAGRDATAVNYRAGKGGSGSVLGEVQADLAVIGECHSGRPC